MTRKLRPGWRWGEWAHHGGTAPVSALTRCLEEEAGAIAAAAGRLDAGQVEAALELLDRCAEQRAKLVITGVGKSGIVARKIAATFSSIGLMAIYLSPLDALHGDLGVVAPQDVVLLLSNSGETQELLEILPHLQRRGSARIALVGRLASSLARGCDVVLDGSVDREACPLNLAPTASTAVAMAIGDALAAVWMERRGISPQDFALNHPAGSLGRQLTLRVSDLMVPAARLHPLAPSADLPAVIAQLTQDAIGACWVAHPDEPERLAGLITDGDLRRALQAHGPGTWATLTARDLMTADPITVGPGLLAVEALERMERNRRKPISILPVLANTGADEDRQLQGLLRLHDLVQAGLTSGRSPQP
ncbi:KpsF/GutQ family sugar-phosphate isomerase [Synechococcus sp. CS-1328]|nr:KpsF/GutQ family sugar-phosphate isomerase [Synechococcus sp. CS-1328]